MAEPWMSVQAPQSWPTGNDQFSSLHLPTPNNGPSTLPFTNVSSSIQWSQSWDVPQVQKNLAGSMTKTPMKVKNQVIEALAVGLAKMSLPDPEVEQKQLDSQEEEEQTPKGVSAKKKKSAPVVVVEEEEQPNIEDELQKQNLYKTELCRSFAETGICRYGHKCQFAHGGHELRPVLRHPKYKTEACKTFSITGQCPYGNRCRFIHQQHLAPSAQQQQQQQTAPIPISSTAPSSETWSTSWTNAGTSPSVSPSVAFAPQSSPSRGVTSASVSASPSPGSSPASQSSRDDNPRRLAFFQGLAN